MILPTSVALGIGFVGWRTSSIAVGVLGLLGGVLVWLLLRRLEAHVAASAGGEEAPDDAVKGWGIHDPRGYSLLSGIGLLTPLLDMHFCPFCRYCWSIRKTQKSRAWVLR